MAFIRADDPKVFPDPQELPLAEDSTSGPGCPDIELFVTPMGYNLFGEKITEPAFGVHAVGLRPTSLGTVRLRSNDPFDSPVIDPRFAAATSHHGPGDINFCRYRYLSTQHDVQVLIKGVKALVRITQAEPLASKVVDRAGDDDPTLDHHLYKATRAEIEEFVRQRVNTLYHPTSTARMARREDGGVVDEELKVYGVRGLRVVDASIFPT
jgi:choline dehydrogenase